MTNQRYSGRIALVTGASRGLGFAVAQNLCAQGATVFALARTLGGLEDLDDLANKDDGSRPTLLPLDITDDGAIERLGAAIYERHGKLDLFVHCAAHAPPLAPVGHVANKDLDKAWKINGRATQQLLRSLDPLLGVKVTFHQPPEMPTALRARFYPGQNPEELTLCKDAAAALLD